MASINAQTLRPSSCHPQVALPALLRLGHARDVGLPWLMPLPLAKSLWLDTQGQNDEAALALAEDWALQLLLQAPASQLEVHVHDTGLDTALPTLERIASAAKARGLPQRVHFITDAQALEAQLELWQAEARQRKSHLLQTGHGHWAELLQDDAVQPLRLLILTSLDDLADAERQWKHLPGLLQHGPRLGFWLWLVGAGEAPAALQQEYERERWDTWFRERVASGLWRFTVGVDTLDVPPALQNHPAVRLYREFGALCLDGLPAIEREAALAQALRDAGAHGGDTQLPDYLTIPIGQLQGEPYHFRVGPRSGCLHTLLAGTTNTGKTSLLNLLITRACETCTPDEVQFLLFDLKQGVSFGLYEGLPHVARLYLHASEFEPVLQTLRDLKTEAHARAGRFLAAAPKGLVPDIVAYNRLMRERGQPTMPVLVVVIDEVQKLFTEAPLLKSAEVKRLVDEVAREGRAYGISFLFSSQSYIGVDLPAGAKKQFKQRLSFELADEFDCAQVLEQGNTLPLRLPPRHLLVNNEFGRAQTNKVVRVDYLEPQDIHHRLQAVRERHAGRAPAELAMTHPNPAASTPAPAPALGARPAGQRRPSFTPPPWPPTSTTAPEKASE